ncbi:hypothetical protein ACFOD4_10770 [Pseudoroseomonas globiformis]|uniref:Uncharacterized protein n=1 Tax=Teichococcus globiformis TaxID=2307229 RepID=A0ABV7G4D5_9PROT
MTISIMSSLPAFNNVKHPGDNAAGISVAPTAFLVRATIVILPIKAVVASPPKGCTSAQSTDEHLTNIVRLATRDRSHSTETSVVHCYLLGPARKLCRAGRNAWHSSMPRTRPIWSVQAITTRRTIPTRPGVTLNADSVDQAVYSRTIEWTGRLINPQSPEIAIGESTALGA